MTDTELQKEINKRFNERFNNLETWVKSVDEKLDNHLTDISRKISSIETNLEWLKKTYWLVVGAIISAIVMVLLTLFNK